MGHLIHIDTANGMTVTGEERHGEFVVTKTFDKAKVQGHLDENKAQYNAVHHKSYKSELRKKNIWKVASIPNWIVEKWLKEGIDVFKDEDWPKVRAKLNDPEYQFLRTSPGKV